MSEEKQDTIQFLKCFCKTTIDYCKLEKEDVLEILNYIDKLQKQLDKLKEVDRQICCEELITKDKYQDILKENEELSQANFDLIEINQKLIEEKPIIKELTEKELNLLEKIDKLQKENKKLKKVKEQSQQILSSIKIIYMVHTKDCELTLKDIKKWEKMLDK